MNRVHIYAHNEVHTSKQQAATFKGKTTDKQAVTCSNLFRQATSRVSTYSGALSSKRADLSITVVSIVSYFEG